MGRDCRGVPYNWVAVVLGSYREGEWVGVYEVEFLASNRAGQGGRGVVRLGHPEWLTGHVAAQLARRVQGGW